jgi:hypothetical protein
MVVPVVAILCVLLALIGVFGGRLVRGRGSAEGSPAVTIHTIRRDRVRRGVA